MAAEIQATPLRVSRLHTKAMRLMLVSRSSRLKPRPLLRCVRTTSPSRISTLRPRACKRCSIASESVLLPAPERPVNQIVKPVVFAMYISFSLFFTAVLAYSNISMYAYPQIHVTGIYGYSLHIRELALPDVSGSDFFGSAAYTSPTENR